MQLILNVIEIALSILLVGAILIQSQGTGLSASFGGSSFFYRTRRGAEKLIFISTILLALLFCITSLVSVALFS